MITASDVAAASARIRDRVRRTPLVKADPSAFAPAAGVWFKLEQLQHTGSFKTRGAFNRIMSAAEHGALTEAGIVAASGGNAGLAFAYAASHHGVAAHVYVPETAPAVKVTSLRRLGANVVQIGQKFADAYDAASNVAEASGALFCHPYDQPEICAGQGMLGRSSPNSSTVSSTPFCSPSAAEA